jgi:hypothetical protein
MTGHVELRRGSLYLARELYQRHFAGLDGVVLLRRDDDLLVLPVRHSAAGGYLLKIRNSAGDRVVHAADFFRAHGVADADHLTLPAAWEPDRAALVAAGAFALQR